MKEKLPVTFRVNPNIVGYEQYLNKLKSGKEYLLKFAEEAKKENEEKEKLK